MADPVKQRVGILQAAVAQGKKLRPEHQQEYDNYVRMGLAESPSGGGSLSVQDNKALNEMRDGHSAALTVNRDYRETAKSIDRLNASPAYAKLLDMLIPSEGGGVMDAIGGGIGSMVLDDQTVSDFQNLKGLQSKRVMDAQIAQKGPQTEADAARLQLAEVSPFKTKKTNIEVMRRGMADATLAKRKLPFFQQWANQYGLNGTDRKGRTADQAWREVADKVYKTAESLGKPKAKSVAGGNLVAGDDGVIEWRPGGR